MLRRDADMHAVVWRSLCNVLTARSAPPFSALQLPHTIPIGEKQQ
jgi:hypothetical protein